MPDEQNITPTSHNAVGELLAGWAVPEYFKFDKSKKWYLIGGLVALLLLIYSVATADYLFTIFIVLAGVIIIFYDMKEPAWLEFKLTTEGVMIGSKFYDYDDFQNFAIVYKPHHDVKKIYFEFKNQIKPRLMIPLFENDPLATRRILIKYLTEDLETTDETAGDNLSRLIKL